MKKSGIAFGLSGFGLIGLIIVVAIVLMLAARAWQSVAPEAMEVMSASPAELQETAAEDASPSPGHLPDLKEMRSATDAHERRVQDTLRQIDAPPAGDGE